MANSLIKSGSRLSGLTMVSRILGLIREITKASFLGTTALSDAFSVAFLIPNIFRRLFAENSISVAFIPTFRHYLEEKNTDEIRSFLSSTFTLISFLTTVTITIGIITTPYFIPFFGTGTDETILLTRIMFPYLAIISVAAFFQGILNGLRIFSPSGITPILFNIIVIGSTYLLSPVMENPARAMATGVLAGGLVQALFQLPFVLRSGYRFNLTKIVAAFKNPGTKKVIRLIGPTIIGMAAYQINDLVSTILAGNAGEGIVSSLQYSLRLQELILGIFAVSIGTVILPDLASYASKKDWLPFSNILTSAIKSIALITIPVTFFSLLYGKDIIILLFQNNNFSDHSVQLTLSAFTFHVAGLFFIALNRIISPAFYAQSDTSSPTIAGILSFIANILLALLLVDSMKGGGIALALSASSAINTIILIFFLGKKKSLQIGNLLREVVLYTVKIIIVTLISCIPLYVVKPFFHTLFKHSNKLISSGLPLFIQCLIFSACGIFILVLIKDPLLKKLTNSIKPRIALPFTKK